MGFFTFLTNTISKDDLTPGDHIYSWRIALLYTHHGIYVGDGMVIHYTVRAGPSTGSSFLSSSAPNTTTQCPVCGYGNNSQGVIKSCLYCFLSGGNLHKFHYSVSPFNYSVSPRASTVNACDPPHIVLRRANYFLNNGFGIYIGDGMVIHFTRPDSSFLSSSAPSSSCPHCPVCGYGSNSEGVVKSCLDCFLSGDDLYRFRYSVSFFHYLLVRPLAPSFPFPGSDTCTPAASDPPDTVLHRANNLLNNGFGKYLLPTNNCVHFAVYCKTGSKFAF